MNSCRIAERNSNGLKRFHLVLGLIPLLLLLFSCGATQKFAIVPTGDKFSDPKQNGFVGKNNRLSTKSSEGGKHIDDKGVYLDPFCFKDRNTGKITDVGFFVYHYNFNVNSGFRPIEEIIFLTDRGDRVVLQVKSHDSDFNVGAWNSITKGYNTSYSESGISSTTVEDFRKIAMANFLEAKIVGGKRQQTYEKEKVLQTFRDNLKVFFIEQVEPSARKSP